MKKTNRYTKDQMYVLIRRWEESGQNQTTFFEEHRICKSTFGYWRKKYLHDHSQTKPTSSRLIPVKLETETLPPSNSNNFEIIFPNGVRIICPGQMDAIRIKNLIH